MASLLTRLPAGLPDLIPLTVRTPRPNAAAATRPLKS